MIKLLFVEDNKECAYAIQGGLEVLETYDIRIASNGIEAMELYKSFKPDVIVSDIDMPKMNGFELAEAIREKDKDIPLLLATGLVSPKDVTRGYEIGIDEYVKKPFLAIELHSRIQAILRRVCNLKNTDNQSMSYNSNNIHKIGEYTFDIDNKTLVYKGRITQSLTIRETNILDLLVKNKNEMVLRSEILEKFWDDYDPEFATRSLDVFVSKLRKYLSLDSLIRIKTVRGRGLILVIK